MQKNRCNNANGMRGFMQRFSDVIEKHFSNVVSSKGNIAVGVSGGSDSMVLCYALSEFFSKDKNREIHALSVDHRLRPEARDEAQYVADTLSVLPNVSHHILTWDYDEKPVSRIQEKARSARYDLMKSYMHGQGISYLFLGHHMNDQAETFLFRLAKGSGLDGLGGMKFIHKMEGGVFLCRPFLEEPKSDILNFCEEKGIDYIDDPSNNSDDYARVRLRKSMDVLAKEGLTPKRLSVTAKRLSRARDALCYLSEKEYKKCLKQNDGNRIVLDSVSLLSNPFEIVVRVILQAMVELSSDKNYAARMERVESLCEDLMKPKYFRKRTLNNIIFDCDMGKGDISLKREHND